MLATSTAARERSSGRKRGDDDGFDICAPGVGEPTEARGRSAGTASPLKGVNTVAAL